jgi:hypothetical protein
MLYPWRPRIASDGLHLQTQSTLDYSAWIVFWRNVWRLVRQIFGSHGGIDLSPAYDVVSYHLRAPQNQISVPLELQPQTRDGLKSRMGWQKHCYMAKKTTLNGVHASYIAWLEIPIEDDDYESFCNRLRVSLYLFLPAISHRPPHGRYGWANIRHRYKLVAHPAAFLVIFSWIVMSPFSKLTGEVIAWFALGGGRVHVYTQEFMSRSPPAASL